MTTPPRRHPRPACNDLIAAFHDHGILPDDTWQAVRQKTLGRDYRRRVRSRLLELRDPLRQRWDNLLLRGLDPSSPASHLQHTFHLCGECDTVSAAAPTGANRCAQCSQVAACPWPEPPAGPRRRTCGTPLPSDTCHRCSHPHPCPMPRLAEPTAPCPAEGGTGQSTPEPAAERRRRWSGAWWQTR